MRSVFPFTHAPASSPTTPGLYPAIVKAGQRCVPSAQQSSRSWNSTLRACRSRPPLGLWMASIPPLVANRGTTPWSESRTFHSYPQSLTGGSLTWHRRRFPDRLKSSEDSLATKHPPVS
ncbi:hypothetical protein FA13DRAFT_1738344 [Coprinellus micaceus]|uniref:Uncharacterized protein n=1 Tax=Coprinellus micaceus TaxID=71717 RepID=A0A4Y7SUE4_COPMI|nr:hypothetical protein FA13DRAFT_1738344 [Coprinellus micaceus]